MKGGGVVEDREEYFSGNEWADVIGSRSGNKQEELDKQVQEFLARGGSIQVMETANRNGPAMFNNRMVSFDYDKNSIYSRDEHDDRFKIRVYGDDQETVDKIRKLAEEGKTAEEIMKDIGGEKPISASRFKRLVTHYLMDFEPAYRFLASYNDLPPRKQREIDQIAINALFEAFGQGLRKRAAWGKAMRITGFTERAIIAINHRRDVEAMWKRKNRK